MMCCLMKRVIQKQHIKHFFSFNACFAVKAHNFSIYSRNTHLPHQSQHTLLQIYDWKEHFCEHPRICSSRRSSLRGFATEEKKEVEVYCGNLTNQIRMVKMFSLLTSATGLAAQPFLLQKATELNSLGLGIAIGSFVGFFTFVTPFLLHWMTKKYVTHLTFNSKTDRYTATTLSLLLRNKKKTFTASDVLVPEVPGMFTTFTVDKTALFVDPRLFSHPQHYARLMGYDKPLDFKLEPLPPENHSNSKN